MIKLGIRYNLFYPGMLILSTLFREIDTKIMKDIIGFEKNTLLLSLIMFFSEIISGLIFYKMNINFLSKYEKKNKEFEYMKIQLIQEEYNEIIRNDSEIKIFFLIFLIAFYDFMEFSIKTHFLPQFNDISDSLVVRLRNIVTISSTLLCYYLYKFPLYKHHKISLLIIFICLILIIFLEYLENLEKLVLLTLIIFTIILEHFFNSFKDVIEKYILEYDNNNLLKKNNKN